MNRDALVRHLDMKQYGDFTLTDAVRPAADLPIRPRQGYRVEVFRDRFQRLKVPMLSASVSAERLFDTFLELLEPLGDTVHVVLETSHGSRIDMHQDYRRSHIDRPVLASYFCDFENLLTHDGCTGVAVLGRRGKCEVQFDEHKLLHVYAADLTPYRRILKANGIRRRKLLPLISEAEHLHHSGDGFEDEFRQLALRLGVGDFDRVYTSE